MAIPAAVAAEYAVLTAETESEKVKTMPPHVRQEYVALRSEEILSGMNAPPEAMTELQGRLQGLVGGIKELVPEPLKPLARTALRFGGGVASKMAEAVRQTFMRPGSAYLNALKAMGQGTPILPAMGRGLTLQQESSGTEAAQALTPSLVKAIPQLRAALEAESRGQAPLPSASLPQPDMTQPRVRTQLTPQQWAGFALEITNPAFYGGGALLGKAARGLAAGAKAAGRMAQAAPFLETMTPAERLSAAAGTGLQAVRGAGTAVKDIMVPARVQDFLARKLTYAAGRSPAYLAEREANRAALSLKQEEALDVVRTLTKLKPEEELLATSWMTKATTVPPPVQQAIDRLVAKGQPIPDQLLKDFPAASAYAGGDKPLVALVNPARRMLDGLTTDIIKDYLQAGFVKHPEAAIAAFEAQRGRYLPIMYKTFTNPMQLSKPPGFDLASILSHMTEEQYAAYKMLDPKGAERVLDLIRSAAAKVGAPAVSGGRGLRMPTGHLQKRSVTTPEFRKALDEVTNLAYRVGAVTMEENRLVANARLLTWVSNKPPLVSDVAKPGFTQMPSTLSQYGPLASKWVRAGDAADIKEVVEGIPRWLEVLQKTSGVWKTLRVPFNIAAWMRDHYTSAMLMDASGFALARQPRGIYRGIRSIGTKDAAYWEARRGGLELSTYAYAEGMQLLNGLTMTTDAPTMLNRVAVNLAKAYNQPGRAYNFKENLWKMAKYLDVREHGGSVPEAVREAAKWGFDYSKVSRLVRTVRTLPVGWPFITFQTKVIPRLVETAIFQPTKIAKWQLLFDSMENLAKQQWGLTDADIGAMKRHTQGYAIVTPFPQTVFNKDTGKREERPSVWDLSYNVPWGNLMDEGPFLGAPNIFTPSGYGMVALQAAVGLDLYKKSLGLPAEIDEPGASPTEKRRARLNYLYRGMLPVWIPGIPGITGDAVRAPLDGDEATVLGWFKRVGEAEARQGGFSASKIAAAWSQNPDFRGIIRNWGWTLLDVFAGLKLNPVDEELMRRLELQDHDRAMNDIQGYIKRTGMRQDIPEAVKEDKIRGAEERKQRLNDLFEAHQP